MIDGDGGCGALSYGVSFAKRAIATARHGRVACFLSPARAITRSVKTRDADRQLSVQPEPTETYADNAATEFVKRWGHGTGMPSQMSQMVTIRLVCGALRHQDRRGVIGYLTDADRVPMVAHELVSEAGTLQTQLRPGGWMVLLGRPSFRKLLDRSQRSSDQRGCEFWNLWRENQPALF